jgi:hypothetical protein
MPVKPSRDWRCSGLSGDFYGLLQELIWTRLKAGESDFAEPFDLDNL